MRLARSPLWLMCALCALARAEEPVPIEQEPRHALKRLTNTGRGVFHAVDIRLK